MFAKGFQQNVNKIQKNKISLQCGVQCQDQAPLCCFCLAPPNPSVCLDAFTVSFCAKPAFFSPLYLHHIKYKVV